MAEQTDIKTALTKAENLAKQGAVGEAIKLIEPHKTNILEQGNVARRLGLLYFNTGANDDIALQAYKATLNFARNGQDHPNEMLIEKALTHIAAIHHRNGRKKDAIEAATELYPQKSDEEALKAVEQHKEIGLEAFHQKPDFDPDAAKKTPKKPPPTKQTEHEANSSNTEAFNEAVQHLTKNPGKAVQDHSLVRRVIDYAEEKEREGNNLPILLDQENSPRDKAHAKAIAARLLLAKAFRKAKNYTEAMEQVKQALEIDMQHKATRIERGTIFALTKQFDQAREVAKSLSEDYPKSKRVKRFVQELEKLTV